MPAFDHIPVPIPTAYGPSIHNDPVAMDNEVLRLSGITDLRVTDEGMALRINVLPYLIDTLYILAAEISGPNGAEVIMILKDLAWAQNETRDDDSPSYPEDLTNVEDALLEVLGISDTTATILLRGVAPLVLRDRITDETPMEVFRAHRAILDARAARA